MNTLRSKNYGKYGLIHLSDLVIHRIEFNAWYTEIKKKNINELSHTEEKKYFEEFISLYNNGNLPHKKYYDMIKYTKKQNDLQLKQKTRSKKTTNINKNSQYERKFIFDDEGKKEKEKKLLKELEQKKKLDEAIYAMNREKAEAMREIELKENLMRYYYQTSNINAALDLHKQVFGSNEDSNANLNSTNIIVNKAKLKYDSDIEE